MESVLPSMVGWKRLESNGCGITTEVVRGRRDTCCRQRVCLDDRFERDLIRDDRYHLRILACTPETRWLITSHYSAGLKLIITQEEKVAVLIRYAEPRWYNTVSGDSYDSSIEQL